jgi:diguanylate cyclase (GGDEF)-like protein
MNNKLLLAFILGLASITLTVYYYMHQRTYSQQYKRVISSFHAFEKTYETLSYDLLKSALYSYNNQDDISDGMQNLSQEYATLYNTSLLHEDQYLALDYPLVQLGIEVAEYNSAVEHYLMLNAGIKNSFVFLLNYSEQSNKFFDANASIHTDVQDLLTELSNMRRLLDSNHLEHINDHLNNLKNFHAANPQQKRFIATLILHISYIQNNYPDFTHVLSILQDKDVMTALQTIQEQFNTLAQSDFLLIDKLATLLLILMITALATVIFLLLRSQKENTQLKQLKQKLEHSATYDSMTGLLNRYSFNTTILNQEYKSPTFLLININGFKHINDIYGSDIGDYILGEVSQLIRLPIFNTFKPNYYRLGGDDFGILLEEIPEKKVYSLAEALSQSIKHFIFVDNDIEINISVTIAINTKAPYLENADMVLKHHKKDQTEAVVVFNEELGLREQIKNNIDVLQSLTLAIEENRIVPYFQPIIDLKEEKIVKYEALVRQIATDGTVISPAQFLELAAQTPLYRELTKTMVEQVFVAFENKPYRFSINLSMRDLLDTELMIMLEDQLQQHPESAKRLEIELLESESLFDLQTAEHFITLLKSYGCRIAIDDFGTGYSNFSYLAKLSVDTLKIDGSLITKILSDEKYFKTVETIVHYANNLGVETVAEFVETKELALALKKIGVTYAQGYYFDKPQSEIVEKEVIL